MAAGNTWRRTMMDRGALTDTIEAAWEARDSISTQTGGETRMAVAEALRLLDQGEARVAEPDGQGGWRVNQWLKKAVLLSFRINGNRVMDAQPAPYFDKVPLRFEGYDEAKFRALGARAVPGAVV